MLRRLRPLRQRAESLLAIVSFGASSLYWLALAFTMSAAEYGSMMTLQATVMLVLAVFTFRTHDLVYYLTATQQQPIGRSWRIGLGVEAGAAAACSLVCALGAWLFADTFAVDARPEQIVLFAVLTSLSVLQGATVAKLRQLHRAGRIVVAEAVTIAAWTGVAVTAFLLPDHPPTLMLILGAIPQAVRSLALLAQSAGEDHVTEERARPGAMQVARYLAGGQMINVVKNGATSIETMIVAAFAAPGAVAMYRLAKSTLGAASAAANVAFQQGFASIAKAVDAEHKLKLWRGMNRRTVRMCLVAYPFSAVFALVYGLQKPEISVAIFELITLGVFAAFLPSVLLQGPFVIVSIEGQHGAANRAFLLSLVVLLAVSALLFAIPSIWLFLAAVLAATLTRYLLLAKAARRIIGAGQGA
jgi:hypothetical protein